MNILWIEDFNDTPRPEALFDDLFSDFCASSVTPTLSDYCADNKTPVDHNTFAGILENYFNRYYTNHSVRSILNVAEFHGAYEENVKDLSRNIDVIIIDINLVNQRKGSEPTKPEGFGADFHENGGLYLYTQIIKSGFPHNRICLMTANAEKGKDFFAPSAENKGSSIGTLRQKCLDSFIDPPEIFTKGSNSKFQEWISTLINESPYLKFRRGVIDEIDYVRGNMKQLNTLQNPGQKESQTRKFLAFNEFLYTPDFTMLEVDKYLDGIELVIPHSLYSDREEEALKRLLLRTLSHEWQRAIPFSKDGLNADKLAFGTIMKLTRDCMSHSNKFDSIDWNTLNIFLLLNFRSMFEFDCYGLRNFERRLLQKSSPPPTRAEFDKTISGMTESFTNRVHEIVKKNQLPSRWFRDLQISKVEELLSSKRFNQLKCMILTKEPTGWSVPEFLLCELWFHFHTKDNNDYFFYERNAGIWIVELHSRIFSKLFESHLVPIQ